MIKLNKFQWQHMQRDIGCENKDLPNSMNHAFNEDLFCKFCGISMLTHWKRLATCGKGPSDGRSRRNLASRKRGHQPRIDYIRDRSRDQKKGRGEHEEG
jgi:hypothetical protein